MLPSTGYFKGLNCPFYDSGLCDRPYCHFRHVKRESQTSSGDCIQSGYNLGSEAISKVIRNNNGTNPSTSSQTLCNEYDSAAANSTTPSQRVTYNPTPIAELKKISDAEVIDEANEQRRKHIPVPYTPRKPISLPVKRPVVEEYDSQPFVYTPPLAKYYPGSTETPTLDPYTPVGSTESYTKDKYLPGSETEIQEYKPVENKSGKHNYVPSEKSTNNKKILEYKPTTVARKSTNGITPSVTYQPTPKSQVPCFSSDEDEPRNKKQKISNDLNGLDELHDEFDILGQILDEEKSVSSKKSDTTLKENTHPHKSKKYDKFESKDKGSPKKKKSKKIISDTSEKNKGKDCKKEKEKSSKDKERHSRSSEIKTHHKSSGKEKDHAKDNSKRDSKEKNTKDSTKKEENKSRSSSKTSEKSRSSHSSSSKTDKHSKGSKHSSRKDKNTEPHMAHKKSKKGESSKEQKDKKKEHITHEISDNEESMLIDESLYEEFSESDEEAIALECKRIFEEYVPAKKPKTNNEMSQSKIETNSEAEYIPTKKRISRTADKNVTIIPKEPIKPNFKVSAATKMAERLAKVREFHANKNANTAETVTNSESTKNVFTAPSSSSSKIRIAHVPYASTLINVKKTIVAKSAAPEPAPTTIVQTVKKGVQRTAHIPNEKFIDRPGVLEPLGSKIPANIRSTYLNMMIDECLKIYLSFTDAYARAQHEELTTSNKCKSIPIYKNSAVLAVRRLRKEFEESNGVKKSGSECATLNRISPKVIGVSGAVGSWSIENRNRRLSDNPNEHHGAKFYANISKWILTEEQLQDNGFPRVDPLGEKGKAKIYTQRKQNPPKGIYRICTRCTKEYSVDKKGFPTIKEECIYHPNRKYRFRGEVKYQCCSQDGTSDGCCIASSHVYEFVDYENLRGYVRTMPPEKSMDNYGIYSLDCEMCYTTNGLDLTRITVINSECQTVYETLIKPLHPIIDYNTRYSGITEEQLADVNTTLIEVQATLLSMFNSKTILIGHSLESDFKALKLIHDTVIDTSVLYPHKMGPPYKRALRNLSSEYLKKIIQNSVDGHDSTEDATVCMELIHFRLKEDLKTR